MDKTKVSKDLEAKTLTIERSFDAPKEKLWRAYADKDWFVKWWGPEGWETTVKEFDFKPDGRNHYCMKCVDKEQGEWYGQESWGLMKFGDINEPDRFDYLDYFSDAEGKIAEGMPATAISIELREADGQTTLVTVCKTETVEELEKLVNMGMIEGFSSSINRLEKLLAE
jgi:uncharacterized protein YndB with AHSA1/START domain